MKKVSMVLTVVLFGSLGMMESMESKMKSEYPEHEKLKQCESQKIGEFISWLQGRYYICRWLEDEERFHPIHNSIEDLLAQYFGIDLSVLENEKTEMLKSLRV